jgi:hypothetical protein
MKAVNTYRELKAALTYKTEDGPLCAWIVFNGQEMFVSKHWSYDGGFPVYKDDAIGSDCIGELVSDGNWYPWVVDGEVQKEHGIWEMNDSKLVLKNA